MFLRSILTATALYMDFGIRRYEVQEVRVTSPFYISFLPL